MEKIVKRYRNRKLYDTTDKKYIKLADIEAMIRNNENVKIIDNVTSEDITRHVLTQLIMRSEPGKSDHRVPMEGLRDMIQNEDSPLFQAFRGMVSFGKGMVQQISNVNSETGKSASDQTSQNQISTIVELFRKVSDKISDGAVSIVNGSLAKEMLSVPTKDDWDRFASKLDELEEKLSELKDFGGKTK